MRKVFLAIIIVLMLASFAFGQTAIAPSGSGTRSEPFQVVTLNNLYWISQSSTEWDKYYIQIADINASSTRFWNYNSSREEYEGFAPIGDDNPMKFTGEYHGRGYCIDSLYINHNFSSSGDIYFGLFGYVLNAVIDSLRLTNVEIHGESTNQDGYMGGLIGYNCASSVSYCYSSGNLSLANEESYVGGLIGYVKDNASNVNNCYSTASNTGKWYTGGLIGGAIGSTIENCYSTGNVSSDNVGGGFIGYIDAEAGLNNCYSSGTVNGVITGGLIGKNDGGGVSNSFWDLESSGISTSAGGTAKTTNQMKNYGTFTDTSTIGLEGAWDFSENPNDDRANNDYWTMDQTASGYPILSWQVSADQSLPVTLSIFTVNYKDDSIRLFWTTSAEIENAGFNIYRKEIEGEYLLLSSFANNLDLKGHGNSSVEQNYFYSDKRIEAGKTYFYMLADVAWSGAEKSYPDFKKIISIPENDLLEADIYILKNAYPNPFNPATTLPLILKKDAWVKIDMYNDIGQRVNVISNSKLRAGNYKYRIDGLQLNSGVYFLHIIIDNSQTVQKIILIK